MREELTRYQLIMGPHIAESFGAGISYAKTAIVEGMRVHIVIHQEQGLKFWDSDTVNRQF